MTQAIYNLAGIQSARTQGWKWLTSAIGFLVTLFGAFIIWTVLMIRHSANS